MSGDEIDPTQRLSRGDGSDDRSGAEHSLPNIPEITLTDEIGRGGMGVVYRGRQEYLARDVAVKLLLVNPGDRDYAARFQREAKILAGLSHPNIVSCYSAGITNDDKPYLVMEYIDGPNLRQWLDKCGPVVPRLGLEIVRDLAEALRHGYRSKIIHRDVKPENVLLCRKVSAAVGAAFPYEVKLADLGLARSVSREDTQMNLTSSREVLGTPPMMAPEQFDDAAEIDHRCDIYGLGCVLYHALTGQFAYSGRSYAAIIAKKQAPRGPDPRNLNPDVPESVAALVTEMLAREPDDRPQTYEVLIRRIDIMITALDSGLELPSAAEAFHDGRTQVLDLPKTVVAPKSETSSRSRLTVVIAVIVLLVVGVGFAWLRRSPYRVAGIRSLSEGDEIELELQGAESDGREVRWSLTPSSDGPAVEIPTSGARLVLTAPNWNRDYDLELVWVVKPKNDEEHVTGAVTVNIAADDDPPTVIVAETLDAFAGQSVRIEAKGEDPEGRPVTAFEWALAEPVEGVVLPDTNNATLSLDLPPRDVDYRVELTVSATDVGGLTSEPRSVRIEVRKVMPPLVATIEGGGSRSVPEGGSGRLSVSVTGGNPEGRTYLWRRTSGPAVREDDPTRSTFAFRVPSRLPKRGMVGFEVVVTDRNPPATTTATAELEIAVDDRYLPLTSTAGLALFASPMVELLKSWQQRGELAFDKASFSDGVMGSGSREAESLLTCELPRGNWRLSGLFDDVTVPKSAAGHGLELELVERRHFVRFAVERERDGAPRKLSVVEIKMGADEKLERVVRAPKLLTPNGYLHFRLTYLDGAMRFEFQDYAKDVYTRDIWDEESVDLRDLPGRMRPRLSVYVEGEGVANFREFKLSGVE